MKNNQKKSSKSIRIVCGNNQKEIKVDIGHPKKLIIFKLGSPEYGWIPNQSHFDDFNKKLNKALHSKKIIPIVFHWAVSVEEIDL